MTKEEYYFVTEQRWQLLTEIQSMPYASILRKGREDALVLIDNLIAEYKTEELASRVYITDEQFSEYLNHPKVENAFFDESKMGDHESWCYVCGGFFYNHEIQYVWYKWAKGDGDCQITVCPDCGGWNRVQDVGP